MKVFYLINGTNIACDSDKILGTNILCTDCAIFKEGNNTINMSKVISINPNHVVYSEVVLCSVEDFTIAYRGRYSYCL